MYATSYIVVFGLGLLLIKNNMLTIGAFTGLTTCIAFVLSEITSSIQKLIDGLAYFRQSTRRYNYFFSLDTYKKDGKKLDKIEKITFKNLSYSYDGISNVLENINIEINRNEKIGIIGQVGSGKTTLMNIISGLLEVKNDMLYINDIDVNEYERDEIFKNIGYGPQKSIILDDSIKNNINIKNDENIDIEKVSKLSDLYQDVSEMKDTFETIIGEKGNRLSRRSKAKSTNCKKFILYKKYKYI